MTFLCSEVSNIKNGNNFLNRQYIKYVKILLRFGNCLPRRLKRSHKGLHVGQNSLLAFIFTKCHRTTSWSLNLFVVNHSWPRVQFGRTWEIPEEREIEAWASFTHRSYSHCIFLHGFFSGTDAYSILKIVSFKSKLNFFLIGADFFEGSLLWLWG